MFVLIGNEAREARVKAGTLKWEKLNSGHTIVTGIIHARACNFNIDFNTIESRIIVDDSGNTAVYTPASAVYSVTGWVGDYRRIVFQAFEVPRVPIMRVFLGKESQKEAFKYHDGIDLYLREPDVTFDSGLLFATHASAGLEV